MNDKKIVSLGTPVTSQFETEMLANAGVMDANLQKGLKEVFGDNGGTTFNNDDPNVPQTKLVSDFLENKFYHAIFDYEAGSVLRSNESIPSAPSFERFKTDVLIPLAEGWQESVINVQGSSRKAGMNYVLNGYGTTKGFKEYLTDSAVKKLEEELTTWSKNSKNTFSLVNFVNKLTAADIKTAWKKGEDYSSTPIYRKKTLYVVDKNSKKIYYCGFTPEQQRLYDDPQTTAQTKSGLLTANWIEIDKTKIGSAAHGLLYDSLLALGKSSNVNLEARTPVIPVYDGVKHSYASQKALEEQINGAAESPLNLNLILDVGNNRKEFAFQSLVNLVVDKNEPVSALIGLLRRGFFKDADSIEQDLVTNQTLVENGVPQKFQVSFSGGKQEGQDFLNTLLYGSTASSEIKQTRGYTTSHSTSAYNMIGSAQHCWLYDVPGTMFGDVYLDAASYYGLIEGIAQAGEQQIYLGQSVVDSGVPRTEIDGTQIYKELQVQAFDENGNLVEISDSPVMEKVFQWDETASGTTTTKYAIPAYNDKGELLKDDKEKQKYFLVDSKGAPIKTEDKVQFVEIPDNVDLKIAIATDNQNKEIPETVLLPFGMPETRVKGITRLYPLLVKVSEGAPNARSTITPVPKYDTYTQQVEQTSSGEDKAFYSDGGPEGFANWKIPNGDPPQLGRWRLPNPQEIADLRSSRNEWDGNTWLNDAEHFVWVTLPNGQVIPCLQVWTIDQAKIPDANVKANAPATAGVGSSTELSTSAYLTHEQVIMLAHFLGNGAAISLSSKLISGNYEPGSEEELESKPEGEYDIRDASGTPRTIYGRDASGNLVVRRLYDIVAKPEVLQLALRDPSNKKGISDYLRAFEIDTSDEDLQRHVFGKQLAADFHLESWAGFGVGTAVGAFKTVFKDTPVAKSTLIGLGITALGMGVDLAMDYGDIDYQIEKLDKEVEISFADGTTKKITARDLMIMEAVIRDLQYNNAKNVGRIFEALKQKEDAIDGQGFFEVWLPRLAELGLSGAFQYAIFRKVNKESIKAMAKAQVSGGIGDAKDKSAIDLYCKDLRKMAEENGNYEYIKGRENEVARLTAILDGRDGKPRSALLSGPAGTGKTAIVRSLAGLVNRRAEGDTRVTAQLLPDRLNNAFVYELDIAALKGGAVYHGQLEGRLTRLIDELLQQAQAPMSEEMEAAAKKADKILAKLDELANLPEAERNTEKNQKKAAALQKKMHSAFREYHGYVSRIDSEFRIPFVLFADEAHMLARPEHGTGGGVDVMNALKPYLADGRLRMVLASTDEEIAQMMKDPALARRFESVPIFEADQDVVLGLTRDEIRRNVEHFNGDPLYRGVPVDLQGINNIASSQNFYDEIYNRAPSYFHGARPASTDAFVRAMLNHYFQKLARESYALAAEEVYRREVAGYNPGFLEALPRSRTRDQLLRQAADEARFLQELRMTAFEDVKQGRISQNEAFQMIDGIKIQIDACVTDVEQKGVPGKLLQWSGGRVGKNDHPAVWTPEQRREIENKRLELMERFLKDLNAKTHSTDVSNIQNDFDQNQGVIDEALKMYEKSLSKSLSSDEKKQQIADKKVELEVNRANAIDAALQIYEATLPNTLSEEEKAEKMHAKRVELRRKSFEPLRQPHAVKLSTEILDDYVRETPNRAVVDLHKKIEVEVGRMLGNDNPLATQERDLGFSRENFFKVREVDQAGVKVVDIKAEIHRYNLVLHALQKAQSWYAKPSLPPDSKEAIKSFVKSTFQGAEVNLNLFWELQGTHEGKLPEQCRAEYLKMQRAAEKYFQVEAVEKLKTSLSSVGKTMGISDAALSELKSSIDEKFKTGANELPSDAIKRVVSFEAEMARVLGSYNSELQTELEAAEKKKGSPLDPQERENIQDQFNKGKVGHYKNEITERLKKAPPPPAGVADQIKTHVNGLTAGKTTILQESMPKLAGIFDSIGLSEEDVKKLAKIFESTNTETEEVYKARVEEFIKNLGDRKKTNLTLTSRDVAVVAEAAKTTPTSPPSKSNTQRSARRGPAAASTATAAASTATPAMSTPNSGSGGTSGGSGSGPSNTASSPDPSGEMTVRMGDNVDGSLEQLRANQEMLHPTGNDPRFGHLTVQQEEPLPDISNDELENKNDPHPERANDNDAWIEPNDADKKPKVRHDSQQDASSTENAVIDLAERRSAKKLAPVADTGNESGQLTEQRASQNTETASNISADGEGAAPVDSVPVPSDVSSPANETAPVLPQHLGVQALQDLNLLADVEGKSEAEVRSMLTQAMNRFNIENGLPALTKTQSELALGVAVDYLRLCEGHLELTEINQMREKWLGLQAMGLDNGLANQVLESTESIAAEQRIPLDRLSTYQNMTYAEKVKANFVGPAASCLFGMAVFSAGSALYESFEYSVDTTQALTRFGQMLPLVLGHFSISSAVTPAIQSAIEKLVEGGVQLTLRGLGKAVITADGQMTLLVSASKITSFIPEERLATYFANPAWAGKALTWGSHVGSYGGVFVITLGTSAAQFYFLDHEGIAERAFYAKSGVEALQVIKAHEEKVFLDKAVLSGVAVAGSVLAGTVAVSEAAGAGLISSGVGAPAGLILLGAGLLVGGVGTYALHEAYDASDGFDTREEMVRGLCERARQVGFRGAFHMREASDASWNQALREAEQNNTFAQYKAAFGIWETSLKDIEVVNAAIGDPRSDSILRAFYQSHLNDSVAEVLNALGVVSIDIFDNQLTAQGILGILVAAARTSQTSDKKTVRLGEVTHIDPTHMGSIAYQNIEVRGLTSGALLNVSQLGVEQIEQSSKNLQESLESKERELQDLLSEEKALSEKVRKSSGAVTSQKEGRVYTQQEVDAVRQAQVHRRIQELTGSETGNHLKDSLYDYDLAEMVSYVLKNGELVLNEKALESLFFIEDNKMPRTALREVVALFSTDVGDAWLSGDRLAADMSADFFGLMESEKKEELLHNLVRFISNFRLQHPAFEDLTDAYIQAHTRDVFSLLIKEGYLSSDDLQYFPQWNAQTGTVTKQLQGMDKQNLALIFRRGVEIYAEENKIKSTDLRAQISAGTFRKMSEAYQDKMRDRTTSSPHNEDMKALAAYLLKETDPSFEPGMYERICDALNSEDVNAQKRAAILVRDYFVRTSSGMTKVIKSQYGSLAALDNLESTERLSAPARQIIEGVLHSVAPVVADIGDYRMALSMGDVVTMDEIVASARKSACEVIAEQLEVERSEFRDEVADFIRSDSVTSPQLYNPDDNYAEAWMGVVSDQLFATAVVNWYQKGISLADQKEIWEEILEDRGISVRDQSGDLNPVAARLFDGVVFRVRSMKADELSLVSEIINSELTWVGVEAQRQSIADFADETVLNTYHLAKKLKVEGRKFSEVCTFLKPEDSAVIKKIGTGGIAALSDQEKSNLKNLLLTTPHYDVLEQAVLLLLQQDDELYTRLANVVGWLPDGSMDLGFEPSAETRRTFILVLAKLLADEMGRPSPSDFLSS